MASTQEPPSGGKHQDAPFPLTDIDQALLAMTDEEFTPISWTMLQSYLANGQLEELKRYPSQLRLYMSWTRDVKAKYGSVTNFILQERVKWTPLPSSEPGSAPKFASESAVPFVDERDYKVLVNDWPYGFEGNITHIVVWSKVPIPADAETGKITDEGAAVIGNFVERHFVRPMREAGVLKADESDEDRVLWFKNWIKLQSVRAVEHAHILIRGADQALIERLCSR